jgi:hypothetical protein
MQMASRSGYGRIEPLEMPGLDDAAMDASQLQNPVSIRQIGSQRLFNQQIDAGNQQRLRCRSMMNGRHADRSNIKPADSAQARRDAVEASDTELSGCFRRDSRILIDDRDKLKLVAGILKLAIDAKMIAPEGPSSNNGDTQWTCTRHYLVVGASTAWRQRA